MIPGRHGPSRLSQTKEESLGQRKTERNFPTNIFPCLSH